MGAEAALARRADRMVGDLGEIEDGAVVSVGGVVTGLQRKWTKKGDLMGVFLLEDLTHSVEVMVFPRTFNDFGHLLEDDRIVVVRARVDGRDDEPKLMAQTVELVDVSSLGSSMPLTLELRPEQLSERLIEDLKSVLGTHPGDSQVIINLNEHRVRLADGFCVNTSNGLIPELRVLLGADSVLL